MVDNELLKILACPSCGGDVKEENGSILCLKCGLKYPVIDNVPVMLIDKATKE